MPLADLRAHQRRFLARFGETRGSATGRNTAFRDAMTSSSKRTTLYRPGTTQRERNGVRDGWSEALAELVLPYETTAGHGTVAQFRDDILTLQDRMNNDFFEFFLQRPSGVYQPGFRIAHAQKSMSLVLKHLWCHGFVPQPPQCPVDRSVLRIARAPSAEWRWTDVNTLAEHDAKIVFLARATPTHPEAPLDLAEWELAIFGL